MGLMLIAVYSMVDMRKTLSHNPCSIAGTLGLLAGSELESKAASIADGSGDMSQAEISMKNEEVELAWKACQVWSGFVESLNGTRYL